MPSTSSNPKGDRAKRDRAWYDRYLAGETVREIADSLGSGWTSRRVAEAIDRMAESCAIELRVVCNGLAAHQIEQHQHIYREAISAWERSKEPELTATVDSKPSGQQTKQTRKTKPGDAIFLRVARESLDSIRVLTVEALQTKSPEIVEDDQWFAPKIAKSTKAS